MFVAAAVTFFVPVDFVQVGQVWRYLTLASLLVGVLASLLLLSRRTTTVVWPTLAFGFCIISVNQLMSFNPIGFLTLLAPVAVGAGLAVALKNPLAVMVGMSIVLAVGMGADYLAQDHLFGPLFGVENYTASSRDIFRSRGLIGQAVPASMIAVGLGSAAFMLSSTANRYRATIRWLVVTSTGVSVITSGTRSAILCALVVVAVTVACSMFRSSSRRTKIDSQLAWAAPLLLAAGVLTLALSWKTLSEQRVFSFNELTGSASLENRNYAAMVFADWGQSCSGACVVFGSGARSLLGALSSGLGFRGFSTVDNLFLSLLWDFGILMLVGILVIVVLAIRTLAQASSALNRAGALLIVSVVVSGIFYDALYIRSTLLLFGVGIGLLGLRSYSSKESLSAG
ncbi:hypothetical protein A2J03_03285 [Rhodococcus sp. EPR-157]|nr:hypothetical protein A2J03_03285 [Rhodococcus sp. EPR-157]